MLSAIYSDGIGFIEQATTENFDLMIFFAQNLPNLILQVE